MPFLSVIVPTMRVGGLDVLFDALAKQTFTDFELVLVDGLYERRKEIVTREAADRFLAVRHVGITPNPFPNCAFCAYANAGVVASTGDVLLFMVDYSRPPADLLAKHAAFHRADATGRRGLMGPHRYASLDVSDEFKAYDRPDVDAYERDVNSGKLDRFMFSLAVGHSTACPAAGHLADGGAIVAEDADPKLRMPAGPIGPDFFHAKNESVRRGHVITIDGWDQDLDGAHLYQDSDFADRLTIKAGVAWTLDPTAIVEIVNPRHVFPFARRVRDHQTNFVIWQRKKAAGYPSPKRALHEVPILEESDLKSEYASGDGLHASPAGVKAYTDALKSAVRSAPARVIRVAMIYGEFCRPGAPFDLPGLYKTSGLTGSESAFFNTAIGLTELGHEVVVFCKADEPYEHPSGLNCFPLSAVSRLASLEGVHAVIAWNEPDYLRFAPPGAIKIVEQQINDWEYCRDPNWSTNADVFVFPSEETMLWHRAEGGLGTRYPVRANARFTHVPNSCNLEHFSEGVARNPRRAVWASSPDRGLHHLLSMWPDVRKRVPDAELRIFYRMEDLLQRTQSSTDETGRRSRYIAAVLSRLERYGVSVMGLVDNLTMAREYQSAAVLPYTFDPSRHTETFGCTVLDACAGGCVPIFPDIDCLPSVHGSAAQVIPGSVVKNREAWVNAIVTALSHPTSPDEQAAMRRHAESHARLEVAKKWATLLDEVCPRRVPMPSIAPEVRV